VRNFRLGKFNPTDKFKKLCAMTEEVGMRRCAVAAGMLALYIGDEDLTLFVDYLIEDGITKEGLIYLAKACLDGIADISE